MSSTTGRNAYKYAWNPTTENFSAEMDANIQKLARVGSGYTYVESKVTTAPPGSPANGDGYIVAASATGAWATHDGELTFWDGSAWIFITAAIGYAAYVRDTEEFCIFKTAGWTAVA